MTSKQFLNLSTRLCNDMRQWLAEVGKDHAISPEYLSTLNSAIEIIDQVTLKDVQVKDEAK